MKAVLCIVALLCVAACDSSVEVLKSPCVGIEDSPCGPKRPVNGWWTGPDGKPLRIQASKETA